MNLFNLIKNNNFVNYKLMILMITFFINIMFMNSNNPLMLSMLIFFQTIFTIMILGKIYFSFWFSYMMFLIFIGGLLILFLYIISLIFNKKFNIYKNYLLILMMFFLSILLMKSPISKLNYEMFKIFNMIYEENLMNLVKLYNFHNNFMNLMMISYLFYMMIIVVKISNFLKGPMRYMYKI